MSASALTLAKSASRIRALVVNDSPAALAAISSILEKDARVDVVATARDGIIAMRTAVTHAPDLIVIDMNAAYPSGLEATLMLKRRLPGTKIMIVSGIEDPELATTAAGYGADAFLPAHKLSVECGRHLVRLFPA